MSGGFDLTGRVAVVTGATKGIGRAVAQGLAAAGATVVVTSRKQERCDEVADQIASATGARTFPLACHVGDWDAVGGFVQRVADELGTVDVLVNNAGVFPAPSRLHEIDRALWRKVFAVNVEGPLRMSQCVAPLMREHGGGSIVNVASTAAARGGVTTGAYAASKAALVNLTRSMALEWAAWGIRVNSVSPGTFRTGITVAGGPEYLAAKAAGAPLGRIGEPAEMVGPVLYLASDASSFVTGDQLTVAGGYGA